METIVIELAPIELIPCSVFYFLELARGWTKGSFHRNAAHVLQVQSHSAYIKASMPFQEYSPQHPHKYGTVGYAGRPSGPGWYVSIKDNTHNHGPGSQQKWVPYATSIYMLTLCTYLQSLLSLFVAMYLLTLQKSLSFELIDAILTKLTPILDGWFRDWRRRWNGFTAFPRTHG